MHSIKIAQNTCCCTTVYIAQFLARRKIGGKHWFFCNLCCCTRVACMSKQENFPSKLHQSHAGCSQRLRPTTPLRSHSDFHTYIRTYYCQNISTHTAQHFTLTPLTNRCRSGMQVTTSSKLLWPSTRNGFGLTDWLTQFFLFQLSPMMGITWTLVINHNILGVGLRIFRRLDLPVDRIFR